MTTAATTLDALFIGGSVKGINHGDTETRL
jgi:hypothetical protein